MNPKKKMHCKDEDRARQAAKTPDHYVNAKEKGSDIDASCSVARSIEVTMVATARSIEITKVSYQVQSTDGCLCYQSEIFPKKRENGG